jgi:hypothetical protein
MNEAVAARTLSIALDIANLVNYVDAAVERHGAAVPPYPADHEPSGG